MNEKYLTVSALTKYIKRKLEIDPHLQQVWVKGEISNFNHHSRGHMYLTIKDNHSRIQAVMFQGNNRHLKYIPENGMHVLIKGEISVFEPYGQYQLYIREMQPDGIGSLYLAYEQLKEKLSKAGYFDTEHKREIPKFPEHIAIITSPTGAAVRDVITTIKRRYPIVKLTVLPVLVQGDEAAESVQKAILYANRLNHFDTIILARGGGTIEDLWCFNEEQVAKAIFHSKIPIITGIGHETDTTISDFVADLRGSTPTGAAELSVPSLVDVNHHLSHLSERLTKLMQINVMRKLDSLQTIRKSHAFHYPKQLLNEKEQHVDRLADQLTINYMSVYKNKQYTHQKLIARLQLQHPNKNIEMGNQKLAYIKEQFQRNTAIIIRNKQKELGSLIEKLTILNPLHIMNRGFAIPYTQTGTMVRSIKQVKKDDKVKLQMMDGVAYCRVEKVRRDENE